MTRAIWPGHNAKDVGPGTLSLRPTCNSTPLLETPGVGWRFSRAGFFRLKYQLAGAVANNRVAPDRTRIANERQSVELTWISIAASLAMGSGAAFLFIYAVKRDWMKNIEDAKYQVFWSDRQDNERVKPSQEKADGRQSKTK